MKRSQKNFNIALVINTFKNTFQNPGGYSTESHIIVPSVWCVSVMVMVSVMVITWDIETGGPGLGALLE